MTQTDTPILVASIEEHMTRTLSCLADNQPEDIKRWLEERLGMLRLLAEHDERGVLRLHYGFSPYQTTSTTTRLDEVKRRIAATLPTRLDEVRRVNPAPAPDQPANARQVGGTHYKAMKAQVWDVIDTWPLDQRIGFYRGNLLRYTMRMGSKDAAVQEIGKAEHYAQKLAEVLAEAGKGVGA